MNIITNYKWSRLILGNNRIESVKYAFSHIFTSEPDVKKILDRSKEISQDREQEDNIIKLNFKLETPPYMASDKVSVSKLVENIRKS